jgi:hypothetical protein
MCFPDLFVFHGTSMPMFHNHERLGLALLAMAALAIPVSGQIAVRNQGYVPFSEEPIAYRGDVDDPVARLQRRLDRGEVTLGYEPKNGYLKAVLDALEIPVSSQTLVFSKTSFQYKKISPQTPRALYFNDDVYVGKVHDGKAIELVSFDARQGAIFYLLDEQRAERPSFQRAELDCTQCHVAAGTRGVPGVLVRSIFPTASGTQAPQTTSYVTGHQSLGVSDGAAGMSPARTARCIIAAMSRRRTSATPMSCLRPKARTSRICPAASTRTRPCSPAATSSR